MEKIHKIPKIIHQIWVGTQPIPRNYKYFMSTWKKIHPNWEYKLWTDEDVDDFPWRNKNMFLKAINPGMKADIWRYEIINIYGGLYVDCDMECKRSFNPIHERLKFYTGYHHDNILSNGIFASIPGGEIIEEIVSSLPKSDQEFDIATHDTSIIFSAAGPIFLTKVWDSLIPANNKISTTSFLQSIFNLLLDITMVALEPKKRRII